MIATFTSTFMALFKYFKQKEVKSQSLLPEPSGSLAATIKATIPSSSWHVAHHYAIMKRGHGIWMTRIKPLPLAA